MNYYIGAIFVSVPNLMLLTIMKLCEMARCAASLVVLVGI
jgi:hypothetical protein